MSTEQTTEQDELTQLPQTLEGALNTLNLQKTLLESQRELIKTQAEDIEDLTEQRDAANTRVKWALVSLALADAAIGFLAVLMVFVLKHYHVL